MDYIFLSLTEEAEQGSFLINCVPMKLGMPATWLALMKKKYSPAHKEDCQSFGMKRASRRAP